MQLDLLLLLVLSVVLAVGSRPEKTSCWFDGDSKDFALLRNGKPILNGKLGNMLDGYELDKTKTKSGSDREFVFSSGS